ncbi:pectin lyase fold/virulence factor [Aspergillus alliaceus]|uniref:pectin lyase n=1 Tax=Petromyces alliaceus TaxID=209559 RepID=A0A5N7C5Z3_PETAA|nr:pectin lyase fold/virulence factor [Aspergillus alliaceus]
MKLLSASIGALLALAQLGASQKIVGAAQGFASGVTGGGSAEPQTPRDINELKAWLTDDTPRVIVLSKEYDYTKTEGTDSGNVCASWGTGPKCQKIIQKDCGSSPSSTGTWYKAAKTPIDVASHKTILGVGNKGIIKGKGLRFRGGASNIIVQNIQIIDLNPEYVWGGDAISFDGADLVWIDHVTTARTGRQHYVFGFNTSTRVTLSNNFINGESPYSTGCNGYHYWTFEMVGEGDQITLQNNYIYRTAGRSPALSGGTLLHAVNNVWEGNNGHALEGGEATAKGIFEGNAWVDVNSIVADYKGKAFTSPDASTNKKCSAALGRACEVNVFPNSGKLSPLTDTSFFSDFKGLKIAPATSAAEAQTNVPKNAGAGKI